MLISVSFSSSLSGGRRFPVPKYPPLSFPNPFTGVLSKSDARKTETYCTLPGHARGIRLFLPEQRLRRPVADPLALRRRKPGDGAHLPHLHGLLPGGHVERVIGADDHMVRAHHIDEVAGGARLVGQAVE